MHSKGCATSKVHVPDVVFAWRFLLTSSDCMFVRNTYVVGSDTGSACCHEELRLCEVSRDWHMACSIWREDMSFSGGTELAVRQNIK
jgi:hypothetical protein